MRKWTVRLGVIGLSTVFVVAAIALAHRDSRNEIDSSSTAPTIAAEEASPVTLAWKPTEKPETSSDTPTSASTPPPLGFPSVPASPFSTPESNPPVSIGNVAPTTDDQVALASSLEALTQEQDIVRGNDESPEEETSTPKPAMVPFPFTKSAPNAAGAPFPSTSPNTAPGTSEPVAEVAQLPNIPKALAQTGEGLKKVAEKTSQAIGDVGKALDPSQLLGTPANGGQDIGANNIDPRQPRTLADPPAGLPSLIPGNRGSNAPPAGFGSPPPPTLGNPSTQPPNNLGRPNANSTPQPLSTPNNNGSFGTTPGNRELPPTSRAIPNSTTDRNPADTSNTLPTNGSPIATFGTNGSIGGRSNNALPNNAQLNNGQPNNTQPGSAAGSIDPTSPGGFSSSRSNTSLNSTNLSLVSASPGERTIEGAQTPSLQLSKRAPEEVRIGRPSTFTLTVKNSGAVTARQVQVIDSVPLGTKFVDAQPPTQPDSNGSLVWDLGDLPPGNERAIQVQLIPEQEGEIGSVASVTFAAVAGVRTLATQPKLVLKHNVAEQVLLSDQFAVQLQITNEGTGIAEQVTLEADLPAALKCTAGSQIVADIGDLPPGKSQTIKLPLQAVEAGDANIALRLISEDEVFSNETITTSIASPKLQVAIDGPTRRFIERQARFILKVENTGNAPATNVDLVAQLPKGFRFNGTGQKGQYDASRHAVLWSLEELPPGVTADVELDVLPVDIGNQSLIFEAVADLDQESKMETTVAVEGLSELSFAIDDDNDPIEVDGETTYTIKVANNGTRADSQVQLSVELPRGATLVGRPEAPVDAQANENQLTFAPLAEMKAKDAVQYRFTVRWAEAGLQVLRARVTSQNRSVPVLKEEATEVYLDR
jgi:uncharacterized repeat protein (TIGR01451 family)